MPYYKHVRDHKDFMKLFEENQDLNPDLDPLSLTYASSKQLRYRDKNGGISSARISAIMQRKIIDNSPARNHCKLVKDTPAFLLFLLKNKDLNPDLDINTLTSGSMRILAFRDLSGNISHGPVRELFARLKSDIAPLEAPYPYTPKRALAKDDPAFLKLYLDNRDLNPDLDINTVTMGSNQIIKYRDSNGGISYTKIVYLFTVRTKIDNAPPKYHNNDLCKNNPDFLLLYEKNKQLNTHLDLETLTTGSNKFFSFYNTLTDQIQTVRICALMNYKTICDNRATRIPVTLFDDFVKLYNDNKDLNPHLDISKLTISSQEYIKYKDTKNNISCVQIRSLLLRGIIDNRPALAYHKPNPHKEPKKIKSYNIDKEKKLVKNDPDFMCLYNKNRELNPHLDIDTLTASSMLLLNFIDECGVLNSITICALYMRHKITNESKKHYITKKDKLPIVPVLDKCPEISSYVSDIRILEQEYCNSKNVINFECPLCGYHFKKSIKDFVNSTIHCNCCKDTALALPMLMPDMSALNMERFYFNQRGDLSNEKS